MPKGTRHIKENWTKLFYFLKFFLIEKVLLSLILAEMKTYNVGKKKNDLSFVILAVLGFHETLSKNWLYGFLLVFIYAFPYRMRIKYLPSSQPYRAG